MTTIGGRFRVVVWHSETRTVYYVIDTAAPENEQPEIVASWSTGKEAHHDNDN